MKTTNATRIRIGTALVTTSLVAAGLVTAAATSSHASAEHSRVLRFGVQFSPFTVIDVPPLQTTPGDYKPGDYTVFGDVLTDKAGSHVGTEAGTGTITRVDKSGVQIFYTMAIKLRGGQITASGIGSPAPRKRLAVTGGTGSFTGVSGSIRLVENGNAANTGSLKITLR